MGMQEAAAALDKANAGGMPPAVPTVTQETRITAEQEKLQLGGKTLDQVLTDTGKPQTIEEKIEAKPEEKGTEVHEGPKEEPPKPDPRFDAIARQQRKLRQEQIRLKQEREILAREKVEIENTRKMREEMKRNPLKALEYGGITYKQLTDSVLKGDGQPTPELVALQANERVEALERKIEEDKKLAAKQRQMMAERELQEVQTRYMEDIKEYGESNQDTYELVNLNGAHQQVFQIIDNHFQRTGKIMSIKDGYDILEKAMEDQIEKNLQSKKWQARGAAKATKDTPTKSAQDTRTITNNMTSSAPSFLPAKTEEERIQRALAALSK